MKVLFIGDIVGSTGRRALKENLPALKQTHKPDFIVVNGENAAGGKGITGAIANEFFELGVHGISMGNHTWDNKDIFEFIDKEPRLIRPANFPPGTPGQGSVTLKANGKELLLINVMGRAFLPPLDCPFRTLDKLFDKSKKRPVATLVDVHAEATSEKLAVGWYLDGKASAVVGTHTHVQTNDEQLLPNGTAYITDVGMTGSREGILGMEREAVLTKFLTQLPVRFAAAEGKYQFHGVVIDIDESTGKAKSIKTIRIYEGEFKMF
ncbi:TIGR00282 family metallophosphoesterase [Paenibacillus antri]|uniref:TIGR00282 family metallophosphoesterase n=1 Tax=Paenibacillus antri TaxID=2582848 RepID=A0A5R9GG52_9BACL|nr:TIGR00282 family metallophosphoesterase [Paenibacillus antri]TLS52274.1 TIGR00282 family metallophosphoesterase [Paenibacillus antri]